MSLTDEQSKHLRELSEQLLYEQQQRLELEQILEASAPEEAAVLRSLDQLELDLQNRRSEVLARRKARCQSIMNDIALCSKNVERCIEAVKNYCHNLPQSAVENGLKLEHRGLSISVSKTEFRTTYKAKKLLEDHPELEDVYLDGDPLCITTVVPEVLERLMASGGVQIDNIDAYRIVSKMRSPSVSIKTKGGQND